jgi:hypothetical protein
MSAIDERQKDESIWWDVQDDGSHWRVRVSPSGDIKVECLQPNLDTYFTTLRRIVEGLAHTNGSQATFEVHQCVVPSEVGA